MDLVSRMGNPYRMKRPRKIRDYDNFRSPNEIASETFKKAMLRLGFKVFEIESDIKEVQRIEKTRMMNMNLLACVYHFRRETGLDSMERLRELIANGNLEIENLIRYFDYFLNTVRYDDDKVEYHSDQYLKKRVPEEIVKYQRSLDLISLHLNFLRYLVVSLEQKREVGEEDVLEAIDLYHDREDFDDVYFSETDSEGEEEEEEEGDRGLGVDDDDQEDEDEEIGFLGLGSEDEEEIEKEYRTTTDSA